MEEILGRKSYITKIVNDKIFRFLGGRVRAARAGGPVGAGHRTGSGGGARPGGDVARPGDAARSPASSHAAYPGNSGSAGGPSLGDAEISECPPSPSTATSLPAAPTGPQAPRPRRCHLRCRVRAACWLGHPWLPRVELADCAFQTHT